jgi:hypothetical protein
MAVIKNEYEFEFEKFRNLIIQRFRQSPPRDRPRSGFRARLAVMRHVIVTRFSVPRLQDDATAKRHCDRRWLARRLDLFRRVFVPSVGRLDVPAVLLCSSESAPYVAEQVDDLSWAEIAVQDSWYGGWMGSEDQIVTRMDSDDAIHEGWFAAVEATPGAAEVVCSRGFLRLELDTKRLCAYSRFAPSPLAAFRGGRNPFAHDHADLKRHYRVHVLAGPYLVQVFHGGNLSTRRPSWYRRRAPLDRLQPFGIDVGM